MNIHKNYHMRMREMEKYIGKLEQIVQEERKINGDVMERNRELILEIQEIREKEKVMGVSRSMSISGE